MQRGSRWSPVEPYFALQNGHLAGQRHDTCRLAGTIWAEKSNDLTGAHRDVEVMHDGYSFIPRLHLACFDQLDRHISSAIATSSSTASTVSTVPRYASMTDWSFTISSGV